MHTHMVFYNERQVIKMNISFFQERTILCIFLCGLRTALTGKTLTTTLLCTLVNLDYYNDLER